ncbi:MAG: hypothetical protein ABI723_18055 [Bacteroidia bacterium]
MYNSKLHTLISSFNKFETNAFEKYLVSPYFNVDAKLQRFFPVLLKFSSTDIPYTKNDVYKKCFAKQRYDDKEMRYLISSLSKHLENFIALRKFSNDSLLFNSTLAKELSKRDCEKAYQFVFTELKNDDAIKDASFFYYQFLAEENHLTYLSQKQTRKFHFSLDAVLHNLETFYLSKKLQLACDVTNLKNVIQGETELHLIDELKSLAASKSFVDVPAVKIYLNILNTLTEPQNEKHFETLRIILLKYGEQFKPADLKDMYQYLKNYCVKKLNEGDASYTKKLFEIHKNILANKRIMNHDWLSEWEYKNIVTISLRLNEKKWCRDFINKYISYLKPGARTNALTYNLAYWYYYDNDYKQTLKQLQKVEFTDVFYQLDARVLQLKIYFETDDYETLFYHVSAFRIFLKRNKSISEYQRTIYRNLVKFTAKLARAGVSKIKLKKVSTELASINQVADKKWLEQKLEELG